jgi:hypothetical protein
MHTGTMRNTMSTCAQYGIVGVPITIFFQCVLGQIWWIEDTILRGYWPLWLITVYWRSEFLLNLYHKMFPNCSFIKERLRRSKKYVTKIVWGCKRRYSSNLIAQNVEESRKFGKWSARLWWKSFRIQLCTQTKWVCCAVSVIKKRSYFKRILSDIILRDHVVEATNVKCKGE